MRIQNNPLVSIALCTYNGERYLREQLDSIIGQTYRNLEIIIVDDSSRDSSVSIISEYAACDNRIKFFVNETNIGFNKNFEKALNLCSGEYIAISDQDDIWLSEKIHKLLKNIAGNWLVFSNSDFTGDIDEGELLPGFKLPDGHIGILLHNYVTGHTLLMNRQLLQQAMPFPEAGYYDWWLGFIASYHRKIAYLSEKLTRHRVHAESVIRRIDQSESSERKKYQDTLDMLTAFARYKELKPADKTFITRLKNAYKLKRSMPFSLPLIKIVTRYYKVLFPNLKARQGLSKLNFAFRYSRGPIR